MTGGRRIPNAQLSSHGEAPAAQTWTLYSSRNRWTYLTILFLASTLNYADRNIVSVLLESIKAEFQVSDTLLGFLGGFSFALFYATCGIPVARWADRGNRKTIITFSVAAWSVMTALCGLAGNYWQLALARFGVGIGESGAIPPAQSLIADYFPPERRSSAFALFFASGTSGYLLSFIAGGQIAAAYGWRTAFLAAGLPGILLAILVHRVLKEPRSLSGHFVPPAKESFAQTLSRLVAKPSYRYLVTGVTLYFFVIYGVTIFLPSFLMRTLHASLKEVSILWGAAAALATLIGTLLGGLSCDRLARRDVRWESWIPAIACALAFPAFAFAFTTADLRSFLPFGALAIGLLAGGLPCIFSALQSICGSARRAVSVAICFLFANLFGLGLGPLLTGALSDALRGSYGADALRYSLITVESLSLVVAFLFHCCARAVPGDLED